MAHDETGTFDASALTPATRALAAGTPADPPPAHRINSFALQVALQSDPPGWWAGNVWEQYSKYRDAVAIAVEAYLTALKAAKFCVYRHKTKPVKKSVSGGQGNYSRDDEYEPVEMDHPLAQVLAEPSGPDGAWTVQQEAAFLALQYLLTGAAPVWTPNNRDGKPVRLFGLTTGSITRSLPPGSPQYPQGAYTVTPYVGNGGWMAGGGVMAPSTLVPAEELKWFKRESPIGRSQWLSKLDTGAKPIDLFECINEFRWSYFNSGIALDTVVMLPGADQETAERVQKQLTQKHGGAKNARKLGVFGGPVGEGAGKASIQQLAPNAKDLDFPNGFEQALGQVLAIFGVPKLVANFGDSSNYATFHGELRRFYDNTISPFCRDLSAFLTRALARPWSEYAGEYVIEIEPQIPKDVDAERAELQSALSAGAITVNEYRMATGRDAWDDGDEPLAIVMAKKQAAAQPPPMPGMDPNAPPGAEAAALPGADGGAVPPDGDAGAMAPEGDGDDSPEAVQDATLQAALSALGMGGDQAAALPVQKSQWEESKHPRDHGKFSSAPGGEGGGERQKIGTGSTGDVYRVGDEVHKNAKGDEGKIYAALAGQRGIAEGRQDGDSIVTPHFKNVLSVDTVPLAKRKTFAPIVAKNLPELAAAMSALSAAGYDYNDPLQVGFGEGNRARVFDFSAAQKTGAESAAIENAYTLSRYLEQFGVDRHAGAISQAATVLSYVLHDETREFDSESSEAIDAERILSRLDGEKPTHIYYTFNGREVPAVAQTEPRDGVKVIMSVGPLPDEFKKQWEIHDSVHAAAKVQKAAVPTTDPKRKVRAEGERWTGADGKQWTKKNGKVVPAPQQSGSGAAQPAAQPQTGTSAAPTPAQPQFDRAQAHAAILKTKGAKAFGFTEQTLAKMPEAAVKTIAAQLGLVPAEQHYAPHAALVPVTPAAKSHLQRAGEWADAMAAKHAERVAQRLGIHPEAARRILAKAIRQVAEHALKNGGKASGTLKVGGQSLRLGVGAKRAGDGPPPREEAKDRPGTAAGSPIGKSMNTLSDPDGGFLVGVGAPRRKRKRAKVPVAALVRKALYGG